MGKSSLRTPNYRQDASRRTVALATFRQQMADFARAEKLVQLREQKRLSQEAAANDIGVSTKSLRAWEHGGGIRWHNAKKLASFYGVEPESLVVQEEERREATTPDLLAGAPDDERLGRIEEALVEMRAERDEHAKRVEQLLQEQSELLATIRGLLGMDGEITLQDRLVQMVRDTAAQAGAPESSEHPERS